MKSVEINKANINKVSEEEKEDESGYENGVVKKYNELLELINNPKGNFAFWYKYINELRMELNKEVDGLETLEEIEPNYAYLYLVNIIINESRKKYLRLNSDNALSLNIKNDDEEIVGLMRKKSTCGICKLIQYQFNNYVLLEIDQNQFLKQNNIEENNKTLIDRYKLINERNI
jgi:hypothetical protein